MGLIEVVALLEAGRYVASEGGQIIVNQILVLFSARTEAVPALAGCNMHKTIDYQNDHHY